MSRGKDAKDVDWSEVAATFEDAEPVSEALFAQYCHRIDFLVRLIRAGGRETRSHKDKSRGAGKETAQNQQEQNQEWPRKYRQK